MAHAGHCHRRGAQQSSMRSSQVSGVHLVRHSSTALEGGFWRYHLHSLCSRTPATRKRDSSTSVFRFHGSPASPSVRVPTSPLSGLGQGVAWAVGRPSVIMARIRPPRPEDRSRHLVTSVVTTKNLCCRPLLLQPPQPQRPCDWHLIQLPMRLLGLVTSSSCSLFQNQATCRKQAPGQPIPGCLQPIQLRCNEAACHAPKSREATQRCSLNHRLGEDALELDTHWHLQRSLSHRVPDAPCRRYFTFRFRGQVPFVVSLSERQVQIARSRAPRRDHMFFSLEGVAKCPYLPLISRNPCFNQTRKNFISHCASATWLSASQRHPPSHSLLRGLLRQLDQAEPLVSNGRP